MGAWWTGIMTSLGSWLVNPWIFVAGVAAISVPIIIHLLNRRKFKTVDWAAMDFLLEADKKNRRRVRLENWLLLFLRCLAIFLIGMLLARPFDSSGLAARIFDAQKFERIVLVDDSLSTQALLGNRSAMEITKERLGDLVRMFADDDSENSLTLLLTSNPEDRRFNGTPIGKGKNVDDVLAEIERLQASDVPANLQDALKEVEDYVATQPANVNRVVYVLSDMRRRDWQPGENDKSEGSSKGTEKGAAKKSDAATGEQPGDILRNIAKQAKGCFVVDVGDQEDRNLVIREVRPEKTLVAGVESRFDVVVANTGTQPAKDVRVKFTAGDSVPLTQTIEQIPPGEAEPVRFTFTFTRDESESEIDSVASRKVKIEVSPESGPQEDRLAADSVAYFAARVVPGIPTLLIDGDPSSSYGKSETFYLRRALHPPGNVSSGIVVDVITDSEVEATDLNKYQVAFLCNVYTLSEQAVEALEKWVSAGGGLVILTGDQVDEELFNKRLYGEADTEGQRLSPVKLETILGDESEERWANFNIADEQHPVLKDFAGQQNPLLGTVKIFRWWKAIVGKGKPGSQANVLVRLSDADDSPALVERPYGKGRVLVSAIPGDADWSTWTSDPSYILMMQEMVRFLSRGDSTEGILQVGDPLRQSIDLTKQDLNAELTLPGDRKVSLQASQAEGAEESRWTFQHKQTTKQGFYDLKLANRDGTAQPVLFAANVDPSEGDLRRANIERMERELRDANIQFVSGASASMGGIGAQVEIWKYLLWMLIGLLLGEQVLGWFFGLRR